MGIRQEDVRAMLGFVADLATLEHPDEFRAGVLPGLRELVPCEMATYNEVDFEAERMIMADDPPGAVMPGGSEIFEPAGELVSIPTLRAAGLTQREAEVLRLVALGLTNAAIAQALEMSPRTVQKHLQHIYAKLGARSRTQAMLTAWSIARPVA